MKKALVGLLVLMAISLTLTPVASAKGYLDTRSTVDCVMGIDAEGNPVVLVVDLAFCTYADCFIDAGIARDEDELYDCAAHPAAYVACLIIYAPDGPPQGTYCRLRSPEDIDPEREAELLQEGLAGLVNYREEVGLGEGECTTFRAWSHSFWVLTGTCSASHDPDCERSYYVGGGFELYLGGSVEGQRFGQEFCR